ncbi:MAG: carbohydrate ABC transporter permease [Anaerolineae bacterium]
MATVPTVQRKALQGWLLASPYLLFSLIFFIIPAIWSLILVFSRWNLISPQREVVGLQNIQTALSSPRVWNAVLVSYRLMIIVVPLVVALSIVLALIVNSLPRFKSLFAVAFFLPYLASGVAVSVVVRGLLAFNSPVNVFLRANLGRSPNWLGEPWLATAVISGMIIWKFAGYYSLIFLSVMQGIPGEIYEAAALDGSRGWTTFWRITLPLLYPGIYTVVILAVGIMFSIFTEPYTLTGGGPQMATQTWQLEIYYQAFQRFEAGYASTVALLNAITTFASILIIRRLVEGWGARFGYGTDD